jgi:hypothetical protein
MACLPALEQGTNPMHSPAPRSLRFFLCHAALLLTLGGLLAACDRHSDTEVPDSYGHGSSHQKSYKDHQIDSLKNSSSFSDTRGEYAHRGPELPVATASPAPAASSPAPTAPPSKFFQ